MDLIELAKEVGLEPKKIASTGGGEYHSPCPICSGTDRFILQPNYKMKSCIGRYTCRQCGIKGDTIQFCRDIMGLNWKESTAKCHAKVPQKPIIRFEKPISRQIRSPSIKWQEKAKSFVNWASREIDKRPEVLNWLEKRGIPKEAVNHYKVGYSENPNSKHGDFRLPLSELGLMENLKPDRTSKTVWIPKGIVIPTIEPSGAVVRVKIRRSNWHPEDKLPKYAAITGSMQGMNLIGDRCSKVMSVVESELDAYALHYNVRDFALVVSVGTNLKTPDCFTDHLAKSKQFLLICHDNDKGGKAMSEKWRKLYPKAKPHPTPRGKDIGEAFQVGENLREWFLSGLPEGFLSEL